LVLALALSATALTIGAPMGHPKTFPFSGFKGNGGGGQIFAERIADAHRRLGPPTHTPEAARANVQSNITGNVSYTVGVASTAFTHFFEESVGSGHIALSLRQGWYPQNAQFFAVRLAFSSDFRLSASLFRILSCTAVPEQLCAILLQSDTL